ncbi:hypothetical protein N8388_02365, partial [Octadecabacter sp.]|nr:hypothetical protein [Octadecabacter sp.]
EFNASVITFAIRCVTTPPTRRLWSNPALSDHVRGVQWGFWRRGLRANDLQWAVARAHGLWH